MIDLQELRKLAEKGWTPIHTTATIIELLDRLEAAEKVCMAVPVRLKQHSQNCDYVTPRMIHAPCTCGTWTLINALAAWQKVKEGQ